jgi:alkylation response protein AidB-like acyl-CoA dehydrogenase
LEFVEEGAMTKALLEAVAGIAPALQEAGIQADADRKLPDTAYDAMIEAGLFGMTVPSGFGGLELHPVEVLQVVEAVARIDSSAGWNLNQASAVGGAISGLTPVGAREVYARGADTIFAGGFYPPALAVHVDGGWRVTARTPFVSGCQRAHWFGVPIIEVAEDASPFDPKRENPQPILAVVPRDEVDVLDTWHTVGLRGTFSADVVYDDVFVPDDRVAFMDRHGERTTPFKGPLFGLWPWVPVHGEAAVAIGIASAAVEALIDLATNKQPSYARAPLNHRESAQHNVARAQALIDAARATLHKAMGALYDDAAESGRSYSEQSKIKAQLAACFATEASATAVDLVHEAAGSSSIRLEHPFERYHRDIHVITQHAYRSTARYTDVGKMLYGMQPEFWTLEL